MCEHVWTNEYPTTPGFYWFYGNHYGMKKRTLGVVKVSSVRNGVCRVLDGNFMFKEDKHKGVFCPLDKPAISAEIAGGDYETA